MYEKISLWACSLGAFFSLLAYQCVKFNQCLFLSPVVDMQRLIENMMIWFEINEEKNSTSFCKNFRNISIA